MLIVFLWAASIVLSLLVGAFLVAVLALIVTLVVVDWQVSRQEREARRRLAAMPCPACGTMLGDEAVELGVRLRRRVNQATVKEARSKGYVVRLDSRWPVTCPRCRHVILFDAIDGRMTPASDEERAFWIAEASRPESEA